MTDKHIPLLLQVINTLMALLPASHEKIGEQLASILSLQEKPNRLLSDHTSRGGDNFTVRFNFSVDALEYIELRGHEAHNTMYFAWIELTQTSELRLNEIVSRLDVEFAPGAPVNTLASSNTYMVQANTNEKLELVCVYDNVSKHLQGIRISAIEPNRKHSTAAATHNDIDDIKSFAGFLTKKNAE